MCFLAWVFWHLRVQTPLIIFENVVGFDTALLTHWMGQSYRIFIHRVSPEDVGWTCCKRPRIYAALVHREKLSLLRDPIAVFSTVSDRLRRNCLDLRLRDLLVAPASEIAGELLQLARLRCAPLSSPIAGQPTDMTAVLTEPERQRLCEYGTLWAGRFGSSMHREPDLLVHLGDNPAAGFAKWSVPVKGKFMLPTLRKTWKVMWCPYRSRWMTIGERALAMGFPAYRELQIRCGLFVPAFQWHQRNLLGNSMHLACIGVWQACVAACCATIAATVPPIACRR